MMPSDQHPSTKVGIRKCNTSFSDYFELGCLPSVFTLPVISSLIIFPLQLRRSETVEIISYLKLKCAASLSIIAKWTVRNHTPNCLTEVQFGSEVITNRSELYIPALQCLSTGTIRGYGIVAVCVDLERIHYTWSNHQALLFDLSSSRTHWILHFSDLFWAAKAQPPPPSITEVVNKNFSRRSYCRNINT